MSLPIVHCLSRRRWLFITATVVALACVAPQSALAQKGRLKQIEESSERDANSTEKDFYTQYAKAYPDRKARYFSNRKIVWIEETFNPAPAFVMGFNKPLQQCRVEYLANDRLAKLEMIVSNNQSFDIHPQFAKFMTADNQTSLRWNVEKRRYEYRSDFQARCLPVSIRQTQTGFPFPMKVNDYTVLLEDLNPYYQNGLKEAASVDAIDMEPCEWNGKALIRVTFRTAKSLLSVDPQIPIRTHHGYFDPHHAWICHGMEAEPLAGDCVPQIKKFVNRFEYQDSKEGYPRPIRFTKTVEYHDGSIIPIVVIKIQSFERAYPQDNEVSLESSCIAKSDFDPNNPSQKIDDFPYMNHVFWKWMIPISVLMVATGTVIGKLAVKSAEKEQNAQVPIPEY